MPRPPHTETREEKARAAGFDEGFRRGALNLAQHAIRELHAAGLHDSPEFKALALAAERAEAVSALREVCAEFGSNDWPDDLHLRDVIEKHLQRPLQRR